MLYDRRGVRGQESVNGYTEKDSVRERMRTSVFNTVRL